MSSHPSRTASALVIGGLLASLGGAGARAEGGPFESMTRFLYDQQQQKQQADPPASAPRVRPAATRIFRRPPAPKTAAAPKSPRTVAVVPPPRKTPSLTVAVYGDRLGQALARGLDDDAGDWLTVATLASPDAGLTRTDFNDWLQSLSGRLRKAERPAVAIVMLGTDDRHPLPDGDTEVDPATPRWQALYMARIDAVSAAFREARVPLIWVGLPSVQAQDTAADFVRLNGLFRDRATVDGATFIDSWDAFSDDAGSYSPVGPDVDGQTVKLRKADGFGFTRAGARKLASFVEGDIKRLKGQPASTALPPKVADITIEKAREFDAALEIDVNALIQREAGLAPDAASSGTRSSGAAQQTAGPVLPLTAPPTSSDGQLATAAIARGTKVQATLVGGSAEPASQATPPRPGRADDFSWPRP